MLLDQRGLAHPWFCRQLLPAAQLHQSNSIYHLLANDDYSVVYILRHLKSPPSARLLEGYLNITLAHRRSFCNACLFETRRTVRDLFGRVLVRNRRRIFLLSSRFDVDGQSRWLCSRALSPVLWPH